MQTDRTYRPSGKFSPLSVALAVLVGAPVAVAMAFVYAYASLYIPFIGKISFLLTLGYAVVVGGTVGVALHGGKVRNPGVASLAGLVVAGVALWASWVVWSYATLRRADVEVALFDLALRPGQLWSFILAANENGTWSIRGATPTGLVLWVMWFVEAVMIVGGTVLMAMFSVHDPFCEDCEKWCEETKGVATLGPADAADLKAKLEASRFAELTALPPVTPEAFTRFDLHQCTQCRGTATLTAKGVTVALKDGKPDETEHTIVQHLVLSRAELAAFQKVAAPPAA